MKNHGILEILTKIQFHQIILNLTNINTLTNWQVFNEIELEIECDTDFHYCDSVPPFESMLTSVSLVDLDPIPDPTLIHVLIEFEHEPPILDSRIPLLENECYFNSMIWTKLMNKL